MKSSTTARIAKPRRLARLVPPAKAHTGRFFHGTTDAGWLLAQERRALIPRDLSRVFAELEVYVGLPAGALMEHEVNDAFSRLDAFGGIWVAEPFHTAVHYATRGSELIEHKLRVALELKFGWGQWSSQADEFSVEYWGRNPYRPIVLALDVPLLNLEWYMDQPDPDRAWRRIHRNRHHREVNLALEPPVPIAWVVAAIDPELVSPVDRYAPPPPDWAR